MRLFVCLKLFILLFCYHSVSSNTLTGFVVADEASQTSLEVIIDVDADTVQLTMTGSASVWYSFGFGDTRMNGTYSLVVSGTGEFSEYKLGNHRGGTLLTSSLTRSSYSVSGNVATAVVTRNISGLTVDHYTFPSVSETIQLIWAYGSGADYGMHDSRGTLPITLASACTPTTAQLSTEVCSSYNSPSSKYVYESTGTYTDTIPNTAGCDSIITIHLAVNNSYSNQQISVCDSLVSPSGKYTWTETGVHTDTLLNAKACDSVITVDLAVHKTQRTTQTLAVCGEFHSPSDKYTWTEPGQYHDTLISASGCDSIISFDLSFTESANQITAEACGQYESPSGKYTWDTSGSYSDTLMNATGCDSVLTIELTVNENSYHSYSIDACGTVTSPSGKYTWGESGIFQDTIPNIYGCDSILTVQINSGNTASEITVEECDQYVSPSGKYIWTKSGEYTDTIANVIGCDSIITVSLFINKSFRILDTTVCGSYQSPSGKYTYTESGQYTDTVINSVGCDSIITINLTLNAIESVTVPVLSCGVYTSPSGKYTWTSSGFYNDTLQSSFGCDSVLTINLKVAEHSVSEINEYACGKYTSPSGKYTWTKDGVYTDTLTNAAGCDSIITVNLLVGNTYSALTSESCTSVTSPSGKYKWTSSGEFTDTLQNAIGCDSVITVAVSILQSDTAFSLTVCSELKSPSGKYTWTQSGTYNDTLKTVQGCDSVITVALSISEVLTASIDVSACTADYTSPSGKYIWSESGSYTDTLSAVNGCDSIITVNLNLTALSPESLSVRSCQVYESPSKKYLWEETGTYTDTITSSIDCDSIIIVNLEIIKPEIAYLNTVACRVYESPSGKYLWKESGTYFDTVKTLNGCDSSIVIGLMVIEYLSGDQNCNGVIDRPLETAGDVDENGLIDGNEIVGDVNGNFVIDNYEIAGDANANFVIDSDESTVAVSNVYRNQLDCSKLTVTNGKLNYADETVGACSLKLYTIQGQLLFEKQADSFQELLSNQNMNDNGVYIIQLQCMNQLCVTPVVFE